MDISLNLQHPDEMEAFAAFLTATAVSRRNRKPSFFGFDLAGINRADNPLWNSRSASDEDNVAATRQAEDAIPEGGNNLTATETTKRTRRTKAEIAADAAKAAETVANLDPAIVAAAAGVHVQGPAATEDEPDLYAEAAGKILAKGDEVSPEERKVGKVAELALGYQDKQVEEQPTLTENDVRNSIIDLLNEAQAKFPADADVRTKTLAPILAALGAQKISLIPATEYHRVAGILAKARTDMDQALAEAA